MTTKYIIPFGLMQTEAGSDLFIIPATPSWIPAFAGMTTGVEIHFIADPL